ncbi:polyketide synthase 2 [Apostichopus japonicus]|uniref:Polyketide synthase 2 n=1 Tax=Stichopus japonicus TaxID=307972 RepID=A0A2G8JEQ9_STIJA|nr:polyketide synthase 2 [Apostichopus japonicus]
MYNNRSHQLVFVFSGMGTQWWAMGRQLMVSEEIFSNCIEEIDKLLTGFGAEWSLRHLLTMETDKDKIHRTDIAQPAICAIQIALAAVYRHFGIHPDVVIGHSVGEVAAAYVAGYLSLSDAVRLIYVRGKCLQETTGKGKMAAILSPVQNFQQELIKQYFFKGTKFLRSPKFPLKSKLAPIHVKMISTVNGKYLNAEVLNSSTYWWNNIRQTVAFENSLVKLLEGGYNVFLEIGPHPSLASPIKDTMVSFSEQSGVSYHGQVLSHKFSSTAFRYITNA